ncbi:RNA-DNA + DNA-DNA helicase [Synechococcus phage S-MbCM100]|uniref:Helicase n=2 Tax=Acionnavirus monteraybay TaxID=2734078 RepID=A0A0E3F9J5_9CAUD|nr:RNA-DNA + DNA-DNA helicase [Synechococcus phage S-MbCM100]AIX14231.1 helicase [Synechococcus phage ACG-2014a]AHB80902.1 RNA-DNA + DNA-DNA helicase [Synechococcus phage S-MbCM100]AIX15096.1 helicase [Synechococcus phage ACG-2014a]AIX16853.1 helicase [Synechococcus phage ACG-2014a]AIX23030.1 helicase [Synechococcus phage ACG-2014a]
MQLRPHQQRAFDAMQANDCGQVIIPTGGGKTYIMIADALHRVAQGQTIVVVAPRILLANQLCEEFMEHISGTWTHVCHAHSGETHYFSSTKPEKIALFNDTARAAKESCIIFTTYHSLHRVVDSGINIDTIYFDEAHNGCGRHFHKAVFATAQYAKRRYYFTATPKNGRGVSLSRGMNNTSVYGRTLCNVPAAELIAAGAIVPPKVVAFETNRTRNKYNAHEVDGDNLKDMFEQLDVFQNPKVLVAAPSSKVLGNMLGQTDILEYFYRKGYDVMHITSKFGAIINDKKVGREEFFNTLQSWGADDSKKFVIFHYSILSEGINVPGLTHTILLRNLPIVEMAQTIGRVIRVHQDDRRDVAEGRIPAGAFHLYKKSEGIVTMPTGYKMGNAIAQRLQNVVNAIFIEGIPPVAFC